MITNSSADLLRVMALGWLLAVPAVAQDLPLSKIADLLATPRTEAAGLPEVRVRGVVSLVGIGFPVPLNSTSKLADFCVEDETAGIWIPLESARRDKIWTADESLLIGLH